MSNFIEIDYSALEGIAEAFRRAPQIASEEFAAAMMEADSALAAQVEAYTPVRTGALAASIIGSEQINETGVIGVVGSPLSYVIPVELGSKPHDITPRAPDGVLHFMIGGQNVFAKRVHHPGTQGQHMFQRALDQKRPKLEAMFHRATERIVARLAGNQT